MGQSKTSEGSILEMLSGSYRTTAMSDPLALDVALEELTEKKGVRFVSFHRTGTHSGKLSIRGPKMYYMLTAQAPPELKDRKEVDDIIYQALERQLESLS